MWMNTVYLKNKDHLGANNRNRTANCSCNDNLSMHTLAICFRQHDSFTSVKNITVRSDAILSKGIFHIMLLNCLELN